jgi:hypothetical protein
LEENVANGKKGDHPLIDIIHWKIPRFSPKADGLNSEIVHLGGTAELERAFDLFAPPPIPEFEASLQAIRDPCTARPKSADGRH